MCWGFLVDYQTECLTTFSFGFATFTPKPHAKEIPSNAQAKGLNNNGGLQYSKASVACKDYVPASYLIAEFFGNTFLSDLNRPAGLIGNDFISLS